MATQYLLQRRLFGIKDGNFMTKDRPQSEVVQAVRKAKKQLPSAMTWIFAPRVEFSNRVAELNEDNDIWAPGFVRTKEVYDGAVVIGPMQGIAIFNADCPIICLTQDEKLAVLHAGYRCLVRANPDEPNIIATAMKEFDPKKTHAWIGYGIGRCCWLPEYDDKPEILHPSLCAYPTLLEAALGKTMETSPAGPGHVSVNLQALATSLLLLAGVPAKNILIDGMCTCCTPEDSKRPYWSHTRHKAGKQPIDGRQHGHRVAGDRPSDPPAVKHVPRNRSGFGGFLFRGKPRPMFTSEPCRDPRRGRRTRGLPCPAG